VKAAASDLRDGERGAAAVPPGGLCGSDALRSE
jgi:hypothetical protein